MNPNYKFKNYEEEMEFLRKSNKDLLVLIKEAVTRGHIPVGSTWFVDAEQAIAKAGG